MLMFSNHLLIWNIFYYAKQRAHPEWSSYGRKKEWTAILVLVHALTNEYYMSPWLMVVNEEDDEIAALMEQFLNTPQPQHSMPAARVIYIEVPPLLNDLR